MCGLSPGGSASGGKGLARGLEPAGHRLQGHPARPLSPATSVPKCREQRVLLEGLDRLLGPRESRALSLPFRQPLRGRQLVQEIPVDLVMLQSVFRFGDFTRPGRGRAKSGSVPGRLGGEAGPRAPSPPGGRAPEHRVRGRRPPCRDQHGSRPPSCSRSLGGASPVPVAWPQEGHRLPPGLGRLV